MANQVDIIIPAYNPGPYITEAIESCFNQSYKHYNIYVIDDCSTQDLSYLLKKYSKINLLRTPKNGGPAAARNYGIRKGSGEFISFLDADDIMEKNKLLLSIEEFKKNPEIGMTCGNYRIFVNRNKNNLRPPFYKKPPIINWDTLINKNWVASGSVTIKRNVFENIGDFNEKYWICEDADYWLRISEKYSIKYIHEILYLYSICPGNGSLTQSANIQKNHLKNLEEIKKESLLRISNFKLNLKG